MPKLLRQLFRSAKRSIKQGRQQSRTTELHDAGRRLLAKGGYEYMTIARLAKEAGMSVGAFYERFRSKDAFLSRLISQRMSRAKDKADAELALAIWHKCKPPEIVRGIVDHIIVTLHGPGRGVVLAAMVQGNPKSNNITPLNEYRKNVSECAVALLSHKLPKMRNPEKKIKAMVQIVYATALDALMQDRGPLRAGRYLMVNTMSDVMCRGLGLGSSVKSDDFDDADDDPMIKMPIEDLEVMEMIEGLPVASSVGRRNSKLDQKRKLEAAGREKQPEAIDPAAIESDRSTYNDNARTTPRVRLRRERNVI